MFRALLYIFLILLILDAGWLTLTASNSSVVFAAVQKQPLSIRWIPAIIVYVIMAGAIYWFAVAESKSPREAALHGAGLGLAMYGVYDMTNYATLVHYTVQFALTDIVWGTSLCATTAYLTKWMMS